MQIIKHSKANVFTLRLQLIKYIYIFNKILHFALHNDIRVNTAHFSHNAFLCVFLAITHLTISTNCAPC